MSLTRKIDRFFTDWVRRRASRKKRRTTRAENIARIERLGFKVLDLRGWHEGRYQTRRYHLVDASGKIHDHDGNGFQSTKAALKAAIILSGHQPIETPVKPNR